MTKFATLVLLLLFTSPALAQSRYAQARELGFQIVADHAAAPGICQIRAPSTEQRQAISAALAKIDPPSPEPPDPQYIARVSPEVTIDETQWLDPLILAVIADDTAMLERMEAAGHPVQARAGALLRDAAYFDSQQTLDSLLARNVPIDAQSDTGATALMVAASMNRPTVVQTLLRAGASPNLTTKRGTATALTYAMACRSQAVVDLLLHAGTNVNEKTQQLAEKFGLRLDTANH